MCAVDALGISAMLDGQDVRISSSDPVSGEPVPVTFTDGNPLWEPTAAVVFIGQVVGQDRAVQIGQQTFGPLLKDSTQRRSMRERSAAGIIRAQMTRAGRP